MNFRDHGKLKGAHSFLSASKYHWLNYTDDKLVETYNNLLAAQRGTELHAFAAKCIDLGQKLPRSKKTLNRYVNDSIDFRMTTEQVLFYSENCFGTCDAICFRDNVLRISDYKSGVTEAKMEQLLIYASLFCLEYGVRPEDINIELRIYQSDDVRLYIPTPEEIRYVMGRIESCDDIIKHISETEYANV